MKVRLVEQERKVEAVVVVRILIFFILLYLATFSFSQELSDEEIQANFNFYFDNSNVAIVYPSLGLTKNVGESTSVTGRYLVDVISAASMKSHFEVDGVTSATSRKVGGGDNTPDELRHEIGLGITQIFWNSTISLNGLYSTEHDYTSKTFALSYSIPFAKKNSTFQVGFVRSWDKVFPQVRSWKRDKDVTTFSGSFSQILTKRFIAQFDVWYSKNEGMLSDAYQVVEIIDGTSVKYFDPIHPNERNRKALGVRSNYKLTKNSSVQIGYRYYWDDWDVSSNTANIFYQRYLSNENIILALGVRSYFQSKAEFFKERYTGNEEFLAVDSKLSSQFSFEYQFKMTLDGTYFSKSNFLHNEKIQYNTKFNFYHRKTDVADWHSRYKNLYAYIISFGLRYKI